MMADVSRSDIVEQAESTKGSVEVRRYGVLRYVMRGIFWPFGIVVHAYHGFWWLLGFRQPKQQQQELQDLASSRRRRSIRKRLHPVTRLLLNILPSWLHGALGYPKSTDIGCFLALEIRISPTKPCGKGSKRKQDDLEDEDEEARHWVDALTHELVDEDPEKDPDYEHGERH
ncbi:oogenesis-related isoform X2 [Syngnathus scovelli]|uniref:oogenesis-related isoform X2 n=1 Tax=Syngnathus scovelli TaxID=161590 RepID=UPI002110D646|nr:oogenesis-related isoform X2 [Syngnathus scovelli]